MFVAFLLCASSSLTASLASSTVVLDIFSHATSASVGDWPAFNESRYVGRDAAEGLARKKNEIVFLELGERQSEIMTKKPPPLRSGSAASRRFLHFQMKIESAGRFQRHGTHCVECTAPLEQPRLVQTDSPRLPLRTLGSF